MSGRHSPHLQRRNGIFHLRLRVPDELRLRIGLLEMTRSLRTYSPDEARLLAATYVPRVKEVFQMVSASTDLSRDRARELIFGCFDNLKGSVDGGYLPSSSEPELEAAEQIGIATECLRQSQVSITTRKFPGSIINAASLLCSSHGYDFDTLPSERQHDLLEGVARAVIEQQRLFIHRLGDRLATYIPADAIFHEAVQFIEGAPPQSPHAPAFALGPTVKEALSAYLNQGRKRWTAKTHSGRCRQLRYLEKFFGADKALAAITKPDVRSYRDAILRLRSNHHRTGACTFAAKQTENEKHRISGKTACLMFEVVKAFLRWSTEVEGYLSSNPAENVRIEIAKKIKGSKARRPFSKDELETLFSQPLFKGCASAKRRLQPGKLIIKDDYFWIIILGFYTGARLGEIVQMHLQDVSLHGAIPYIDITDENGGKAGSANAKHVKSQAGIRRVPLHPDILTLGFAEFFALRSKHRKSIERLFHRIPFGSDGQASTVASQWYARFLDNSGLSDPALVFHSLRHNAEDAFRDALLPQYVTDFVLGHSDGATSAGYGDGISLGSGPIDFTSVI